MRRMRRLRRTPALRRAFRETRIDPSALVLPVFVKQGIDEPEPVASMPGVFQDTERTVVERVRSAHQAGVGGVLLFGVPAVKDADGSGGWDADGPVPSALRRLRDVFGDDIVLWADVCQCEYTDHGHCGPLDTAGEVDNDAAVAAYVRDALAYADAGADIVAPSGMMDGQVAAIRTGLDEAGHTGTSVVAYAAKYASVFYGPFREAAESTLATGDRRTHQMDPANRREAAIELDLDAAEGADALMVKPALPYLDVIADARRRSDLPIAAYQVSGEYSMIAAAAAQGWLDRGEAMHEAVGSILRAGADVVLTYAAVELARGGE